MLRQFEWTGSCCATWVVSCGLRRGEGLYNLAVPKRHCIERAQWRLVLGRDAARLSEHYKLDCDFGTPVVDIYKTGESTDPVYLCEKHIGQVPRARARGSEIRLVESAVEISAESPLNLSAVSSTPVQTISAEIAKPAASIAPRPVATINKPKTPRAIASRPPARDLTYGIPAKALVDEAIWNLTTGDYELYKAALRLGKSAGEAAQAAGGQLAVVHRKICEYTVKLETVLAASTVKIDAREAIDAPFETAMLEIMENTTIAEPAREAAIEQLGMLQECVNRGLEREITPLQALQAACLIAERAKWGADAALSEELRPAYRTIYGSVRKALRTAVPHANNLEERLTNLYAAKSEMEKEPAPKVALQSLTA